MADVVEKSSLESPKKRPRLENYELVHTLISEIDAESSHEREDRNCASLCHSGDGHFEAKPWINFDPDSGGGFEHELPQDATISNDSVSFQRSNFTNLEDGSFSLPDDSSEQNCHPSQSSSSSHITSDPNASPETNQSIVGSMERDESSDEDSGGSLEDNDLDLGLGDCDLEQPMTGPRGWLQRQMMSGVDPRSILSKLLPTASSSLPSDLDEFEVWSIIASYFQMLQEPPRRKKLTDVNTFDDALHLIRTSKRILVLTGAGVSVSCGIPDFRSRDGVYSRLAVDFPDLPDPHAIFDIHYFRRNPRPFFKFAKEIYPGEFTPSTCHKFIALLEQHDKLLRNFSQNIDTLEQVAGITKVVQCHGSFANAHCTNCNLKVDADFIRANIFNQVVPLCPSCPPDPDILAVMKPDIVFFGEGLPNDFYHCLDQDKDMADLLIVIGSSLKVQPVATIPNTLPGRVPQILINREPLNHLTFDIELLGDGDVIVNEICRRLGDSWDHICSETPRLVETLEMPAIPDLKETLSQADAATLDTEVVDSTQSEQTCDVGVDSKLDEEPSSSSISATSGVNPSIAQLADKAKDQKDPLAAQDNEASPVSSCNSETLGRDTAQNCHVISTVCEEVKTADCLPTRDSLSPDVDSGSDRQRMEVDNSKDAELLDSLPSSSTTGDNSCGLLKRKDHASGEGEHQPSTRKRNNSIALYLQSSSYLFVPPNRYIFHGAEVFPPSMPSSRHSDDDDGSGSHDHIINDHDDSQEQPGNCHSSEGEYSLLGAGERLTSARDGLNSDLLDTAGDAVTSATPSGLNAASLIYDDIGRGGSVGLVSECLTTNGTEVAHPRHEPVEEASDALDVNPLHRGNTQESYTPETLTRTGNHCQASSSTVAHGLNLGCPTVECDQQAGGAVCDATPNAICGSSVQCGLHDSGPAVQDKPHRS